jgi:hypothetical protein
MRANLQAVHPVLGASDVEELVRFYQCAYPTDRPAFRFVVTDVDEIYQEFVEGGGIRSDTSPNSPWASPKDTPWGTREFRLRGPSQNSLQFYRPL